MSDYEPSDPVRLLGTMPPSALVAQPESAAILPMRPAVVSQPALTTAEPAVRQVDGANGPTPLRTIQHPEPQPQGGPRPVPFHPED